MSDRSERLRHALEAAFTVHELEIIDESHLHAGHAGAREGKGHFQIRIVAADFAGLPALKRHRLIFKAVDELLRTDIHALSIDARVPGE